MFSHPRRVFVPLAVFAVTALAMSIALGSSGETDGDAGVGQQVANVTFPLFNLAVVALLVLGGAYGVARVRASASKRRSSGHVRISLAVAAALAFSIAGTGLAHAEKPARGCGRGFDRVTRVQALEILWAEYPNGSEANKNAFLDRIDSNGDDLFCVRQLPPGSNWVDNTANV